MDRVSRARYTHIGHGSLLFHNPITVEKHTLALEQAVKAVDRVSQVDVLDVGCGRGQVALRLLELLVAKGASASSSCASPSGKDDPVGVPVVRAVAVDSSPFAMHKLRADAEKRVQQPSTLTTVLDKFEWPIVFKNQDEKKKSDDTSDPPRVSVFPQNSSVADIPKEFAVLACLGSSHCLSSLPLPPDTSTNVPKDVCKTLAATLARCSLLQPQGGVLLLAELFWAHQPSEEYLKAFGCGREEYATWEQAQSTLEHSVQG